MEKNFLDTLLVNGIIINDTKKRLLDLYYKQLVLNNIKTNLTSIIDRNDVYIKHFLDSIFPFIHVNKHKYNKVIDIGSGAGFPGIILKIIFPCLSITLVEVNSKKIRFLKHIINILDLKNIKLIHDRAEKLQDYRYSYDIATCRAVGSLNITNELCFPFLKIGGLCIAYKSKNGANDFIRSKKKLKKLGGKLIHIEKTYLYHNEYYREYYFIKKVRRTPRKYPRDYSVISFEEKLNGRKN